MSEPVTFGPFLGVDNFNSTTSSAFLPTEAGVRLLAATNVVANRRGQLLARKPAVLQAETWVSKQLINFADMVLVQDDNTLYDLASGQVLLFGLTDVASWWEAYGKLWITSAGGCWIIHPDRSVQNWGQALPTFSQAAGGVGTLAAGQYLVTVTTVDAFGVESGTAQIQAFTANGLTTRTVSLLSTAPEAVLGKVYCSDVDGRVLNLVATVPIANFPYTITTTRVSFTPAETLLMVPPFVGSGVGSYKDRLLIWKGNWCWLTSAISQHCLRPSEVIHVPDTIRQVIGLESGIWIATDGGLWWVAGETLESLIKIKVNTYSYAKGGLVVDARHFESLQASGKVACFIADSGLVLGLENGTAVAPLAKQYNFSLSASSHAHMTLVAEGDTTSIAVVVD